MTSYLEESQDGRLVTRKAAQTTASSNVISESTSQVNSVNFQDVRYITKDALAKFQVNILQIVETNICKQTNGNRTEDLDEKLCSRQSEDMAIKRHIDEFREALKLACNK
jgi:hypothetical protein